MSAARVPSKLADQGRRLSGWLSARDEGSDDERANRAGGSSSGLRNSLHTTRSRPYIDGDDGQGHDEADRSKRQKPRLAGGSKAILAFVLSLIAFTIQTEAAQYVQQALGYRKPFLSLFLGHSSFVCLFPLYILCLRFAEPGVPLSHQFHLIAVNLHWQLSTPTRDLPRPTPDSIRKRLSSLSMRGAGGVLGASRGGRQRSGSAAYRNLDIDIDELPAEDFDVTNLERQTHATNKAPPLRSWSEKRFGFHIGRLLGAFAVLTFGITVPALSWYSAVPLTSMADITTIYNTYAIWALVFSIWFLGEEWEKRKVFSVLLACGGVVLVAYGGAEHRRRPREPIDANPPPDQDGNRPAAEAAALARSLGSALLTSAKRQIWSERDSIGPIGSTPSASSALLGDMLAFFGAVTMAAYEMAFKVLGTLPDEEAQLDRYEGFHREHDFSRSKGIDGNRDDEGEALLSEEAGINRAQAADSTNANSSNRAVERPPADTERTAIWKPSIDGDLGATGSPSYQSVSPSGANEDVDDAPLDKADNSWDQPEAPASAIGRPSYDAGDGEERSGPRSKRGSHAVTQRDWIPPPLPFGLHPIIMTSGIGLVTVTVLWIGLPIANALGWEPFELPPNFTTVFYLFVVAFTGIIFNGCFSILLAIWGPVLASVSCLLTTVLVFAADIMLGHDFRWISLLGCVSIVAGFGVLVSGGEV